MGRSNSADHLFLVYRSDAGQFIYHREVAAPVADLVLGQVMLLWSGRKRLLTGKRIIKILGGMGDEKTARQQLGCGPPPKSTRWCR